MKPGMNQTSSGLADRLAGAAIGQETAPPPPQSLEERVASLETTYDEMKQQVEELQTRMDSMMGTEKAEPGSEGSPPAA